MNVDIDQELARLRALVRTLEDDVRRRRCIDYDIVLGEHGGVRLCGPRVLSGPSDGELAEVKRALVIIDDIARDNGLELDAVVFRKAEGA